VAGPGAARGAGAVTTGIPLLGLRRLRLIGEPCVECGGKMVTVSDVYEESVEDAIEQSAHVRYCDAPALHTVDSIAALKRF
jgi:hypothetical protein